MKLIEELNQKSEKDYLDSYFEGIAKLSNIRGMVRFHKKFINESLESLVEDTEFEFSQMDFLRCKGNFATKQKIFEAIDAMKKNPNIKIVRIKNRIKVIGDVMVNFWYKERMLGEC